MNSLEEVRVAEFVSLASSEAVYDWLRNLPKKKTSDYFFDNGSTKPIEERILARNEKLTDLGLAFWGAEHEMHKALYQRHASKTVCPDWPPKEGTYAYAILVGLLGNPGINFSAWTKDFNNFFMPLEDVEWLIIGGDTDFVDYLHSNLGVAEGLLSLCSKKSNVYANLDDDRWLRCIVNLGRNKTLHRKSEDDREDPDLAHWSIHEGFINAALNAPKNSDGARLLGNVFHYFPEAATKESYVSTELLDAAVKAWQFEIEVDSDKYSFFNSQRSCDGLGPTERIRFQMLRRYSHSWLFSPDSESRDIRLAAYATAPVNGGKKILTNHEGTGLDAAKFVAYAEKDGAAFAFATSLNQHIWNNEVLARQVRMTFQSDARFCPEDPMEVYGNIKAIENAKRKYLVEDDEDADPEESESSKLLRGVQKLTTELATTKAALAKSIGDVYVWVVGLTIAAAGIHFFGK